MFTNTAKTFVAALAFVAASVTLVSTGYAAPRGQPDAREGLDGPGLAELRRRQRRQLITRRRVNLRRPGAPSRPPLLFRHSQLKHHLQSTHSDSDESVPTICLRQARTDRAERQCNKEAPMRNRFSVLAVTAAAIWTVSPQVAAAQTFARQDGLATAEFWSSRYRRFYEGQNGPGSRLLDEFGRPAADIMAPPDILICHPQSWAPQSNQTGGSDIASLTSDMKLSDAEAYERWTFRSSTDGAASGL